MIVIIDYGRGNIRSVLKAFQYLGFKARYAENPDDLNDASGIVLPGVGAFGDGMKQLEKRGFVSTIKDAVNDKIPFLGICLGMQLIFESSEENPNVKGLSLLEGRNKLFETDQKIPHMGWNRVQFCKGDKWKENNGYFYFVHSYHVTDINEEVAWGVSNYDGDFVSAVQSGNIYGTQFHPEKSQKLGLSLLKAWGDIC